MGLGAWLCLQGPPLWAQLPSIKLNSTLPHPTPAATGLKPFQQVQPPHRLPAVLGSHPHLRWAAASTSLGGADSCRLQAVTGSF